MITDDEVMSLFARADPARADDTSPDVDVPGALDDLRMRGTQSTVVEITPTDDVPTNGHHWRTITAAAAVAVALVAGALLFATGDNPTNPASSQISVAPSVAPPAGPPDPVEEFEQWAEHMGTPVTRPACYTAPGTTASALTCYGLIRNDAGPGFSSVLVATAVLGDPGIDRFTRVSIGETSDGTAPTTTPAS
jgi:hypothetical protein